MAIELWGFFPCLPGLSFLVFLQTLCPFLAGSFPVLCSHAGSVFGSHFFCVFSLVRFLGDLSFFFFRRPFLNALCVLQPQGLCTCGSLHLECSFPGLGIPGLFLYLVLYSNVTFQMKLPWLSIENSWYPARVRQG